MAEERCLWRMLRIDDDRYLFLQINYSLRFCQNGIGKLFGGKNSVVAKLGLQYLILIEYKKCIANIKA